MLKRLTAAYIFLGFFTLIFAHSGEAHFRELYEQEKKAIKHKCDNWSAAGAFFGSMFGGATGLLPGAIISILKDELSLTEIYGGLSVGVATGGVGGGLVGYGIHRYRTKARRQRMEFYLWAARVTEAAEMYPDDNDPEAKAREEVFTLFVVDIKHELIEKKYQGASESLRMREIISNLKNEKNLIIADNRDGLLEIVLQKILSDYSSAPL